MPVTVFHHTNAGEGEWSPARLKAHLAAAGLHGRYCAAEDAASDALIRDAEGLVLVVGGDGTVARAAMLIDRARATLAILPTGGANNIARSLGVLASSERVLDGLRGDRTTELPIGALRLGGATEAFVEAAGIGALTRSMETPMRGLPRSRKRGVGLDALRRTLLDQAPCRAAISLDGAAVEEPVLMLEFLNIDRIGPALRLAPRTEPRDGRLTASWLPAAARDAMLDWLAAPDAGPPPLREARIRLGRLRLEDEPIRLDERIRPGDGPAEITLQDAPVRVLVPETAP